MTINQNVNELRHMILNLDIYNQEQVKLLNQQISLLNQYLLKTLVDLIFDQSLQQVQQDYVFLLLKQFLSVKSKYELVRRQEVFLNVTNREQRQQIVFGVLLMLAANQRNSAVAALSSIIRSSSQEEFSTYMNNLYQTLLQQQNNIIAQEQILQVTYEVCQLCNYQSADVVSIVQYSFQNITQSPKCINLTLNIIQTSVKNYQDKMAFVFNDLLELLQMCVQQQNLEFVCNIFCCFQELCVYFDFSQIVHQNLKIIDIIQDFSYLIIKQVISSEQSLLMQNCRKLIQSVLEFYKKLLASKVHFYVFSSHSVLITNVVQYLIFPILLNQILFFGDQSLFLDIIIAAQELYEIITLKCLSLKLADFFKALVEYCGQQQEIQDQTGQLLLMQMRIIKPLLCGAQLLATQYTQLIQHMLSLLQTAFQQIQSESISQYAVLCSSELLPFVDVNTQKGLFNAVCSVQCGIMAEFTQFIKQFSIFNMAFLQSQISFIIQTVYGQQLQYANTSTQQYFVSFCLVIQDIIPQNEVYQVFIYVCSQIQLDMQRIQQAHISYQNHQINQRLVILFELVQVCCYLYSLATRDTGRQDIKFQQSIKQNADVHFHLHNYLINLRYHEVDNLLLAIIGAYMPVFDLPQHYSYITHSIIEETSDLITQFLFTAEFVQLNTTYLQFVASTCSNIQKFMNYIQNQQDTLFEYLYNPSSNPQFIASILNVFVNLLKLGKQFNYRQLNEFVYIFISKYQDFDLAVDPDFLIVNNFILDVIYQLARTNQISFSMIPDNQVDQILLFINFQMQQIIVVFDRILDVLDVDYDIFSLAILIQVQNVLMLLYHQGSSNTVCKTKDFIIYNQQRIRLIIKFAQEQNFYQQLQMSAFEQRFAAYL